MFTLTQIAPNFHRLDRQGATPLTIWFSYQTPIAFQSDANSMAPTVRTNAWGPTTGKHLNAIDGGATAAVRNRVQPARFEALLAMYCTPRICTCGELGLCPICGDPVALRDRCADGRLIASCGDTFSTTRWLNN